MTQCFRFTVLLFNSCCQNKRISVSKSVYDEVKLNIMTSKIFIMSAQCIYLGQYSVSVKYTIDVGIKCKLNTNCNVNFDFCSYISEHLAWH